ncbi:helix-turn-helix domain-containing protein [Pseudonocardia halophobica]|uniref:helix-turn-helix domain-containing protein n=1 Tax=Pseudonocardia halophobica TaxID=29401 RepID=UPI003D8D66E7
MTALASSFHVPDHAKAVIPSVIEAAASVARAITKADDLDEVLRSVARAFTASVGVSRCSLSIPDTTTSGYRLAVSLGKADYTSRAQAMVDGTDALSLEVLERRAPVIIRDLPADPRLAPWVSASTALGAYSMIGVPLTFDDDVVALAFLDSEFQHAAYSPWQIDAAEQLGALCGASLVTASVLADRQASLRRAHEENEALRRLFRLDNLLENLTADGVSPEVFAGNAARLLGRPVSVYDRYWRRVADASPGGSEPIRPVDLTDKAVRSHQRIRAELEQVRRGRTRLIAPLPALGVHSRCIVAPVALGAENWGVLVVHEAGRSFQAFESEASARVGARFGAALNAANDEATTVAALRSSVVRDLLRGEGDVAELSGRAQAAGIATDTAHTVIHFDTPSPTAMSPQVQERLIALAGSALGAGCVVPLVEDDGALVVFGAAPAGSASDPARIMNRRLGEDAGLADITAIVSRPFQHPTDADDAYVECRQAMRCAHRFRHPGLPRAVRVSEFGTALPFMASVDVAEARSYARKHLHGLTGSTGEDELMTTLRVFNESLNVRRCARALGVHENTVRYRLARIEKLTGLDLLNDAGDQLRAELSVSALRLVGDLPWEIAAAGA